jgi:hypothetical protein
MISITSAVLITEANGTMQRSIYAASAVYFRGIVEMGKALLMGS